MDKQVREEYMMGRAVMVGGGKWSWDVVLGHAVVVSGRKRLWGVLLGR